MQGGGNRISPARPLFSLMLDNLSPGEAPVSQTEGPFSPISICHPRRKIPRKCKVGTSSISMGIQCQTSAGDKQKKRPILLLYRERPSSRLEVSVFFSSSSSYLFRCPFVCISLSLSGLSGQTRQPWDILLQRSFLCSFLVFFIYSPEYNF